MFKNVLVPTDGSELSAKTVKRAVQIAKAMKAKVTALHAYPEPHTSVRYEYVGPFNLKNRRDYASKYNATANSYLTTITKAANTAGVEADSVAMASDRPYEAIIKTAKRKKCDLIIMGSHGRSGVAGILLGSVTQKVLSHSTLPVLVLR